MVASGTERQSPRGWGLGTRLANALKKIMVRWDELWDRENHQHDDERWRLDINYPASDRLRVERESFGGLVQICPLVHFHNFQLVLPSVYVAHPWSFGLIMHAAILRSLRFTSSSHDFFCSGVEGMNVHKLMWWDNLDHVCLAQEGSMRLITRCARVYGIHVQKYLLYRLCSNWTKVFQSGASSSFGAA